MWITAVELLVIAAMCLVIGALHLKTTLLINIEDLIAQAESKDLPGAQKMQWVVAQIYSELAPIAKAYFTPTRIQTIAQAVFDRVRKYAKRYAERTKEN